MWKMRGSLEEEPSRKTSGRMDNNAEERVAKNASRISADERFG